MTPLLTLVLFVSLNGFDPVKTQLTLFEISPSLTTGRVCQDAPIEPALTAGKVKRVGIYGIVCRKNNKWYIGQSYNLDERKRYHFSRLINHRHHNAHLQSAFNSIGLLWFEFVVIEEHPRTGLDARETYWIAHYHSNERQFGYNKELGGRAYKVVSDETRRKLSIAGSGPRTVKQLDGAKRAVVTKRLRGVVGAFTGKKHSDESRRRMSVSAKRRCSKTSV